MSARAEPATVTPADCRQARAMLEASAADMARLLGLSDGRAVRRFETEASRATARPPQGPLAILYRLILDGAITRADLEPAAADPPSV
ncbi:MAG TPA: hypothetical protein VK973_05845 [Arenicellales bacterium]|nr:hypothetical protein [Arenicellales bacterium]